MFSFMQAMSILSRHKALIDWGNSKLPEAQQFVSEVQAFHAKHQKTLEGLVPAMNDFSAIMKKHDTSLKELYARIPEIQQTVNEFSPMLKQGYGYVMDNMDTMEVDPNA